MIIIKYNFSSLSSPLLILIILTLIFSSVDSTRIVITNNCSYTVWAAANPGGGKRLSHGETWTLKDLPSGRRGRIWGRTNCAGFGSDGRGGRCESGDCGGLLECAANGRPPNTVVEYSIDKSESDEFSVSVANGFNIPIHFGAAPSSAAVCNESVRCAADVNAPCPMELRDPGGCNSPCTVFQTDQFCCATAAVDCVSTTYSDFFEKLCPEAVSYPFDTPAKTRRCQTGIEYNAVFCPDEAAISPNPAYNPVFEIHNNCSYTVWVAAIPGGSRKLEGGDRWFINEKKGISAARIWGRTNCSFDVAGKGTCETGDCGSGFECSGWGKPPNTLAEYKLVGFQNLDFFDISLVDGFNIPMEFVPTSNGCVRGPRCAGERILRECPANLSVPGGCNNPCTVFRTPEYCCTDGKCGPTALSRFFKDRCPDAYTYPMDDATSMFTCPGGTYYRVIFCP